MNKTEAIDRLNAIEGEVKELRNILSHTEKPGKKNEIVYEEDSFYVLELREMYNPRREVYVLVSVPTDTGKVYAWTNLRSSEPWGLWDFYPSGQDALDKVFDDEFIAEITITPFYNSFQGMAYFYKKYMEVHT